MPEKLEMRVTPPKMMASVAAVRPAPIHARLMPEASERASQSVLLCTTWLAMPKVMVMSTAKSIPIHRLWSPYCM